MAETESSSINFRLVRPDADGLWASFARLRARWWFRILAWLALLSGAGAFGVWYFIARDLPSVEALRTYEPPLPTNLRAAGGEPIATFARERRVELAFNEYPQLLIRAFLAAEDRTFFEHGGLDYPGLVRAAFEGFTRGETPRGTSTITQQVAKNLLLTNEVSYARKLKEAILAWRIEETLSKQQILELYLNQIFLGRNAYGVEAAADAYFNKPVTELSLPQMAYLAILPKAPANYDPIRHTDRALERRNWVLGEMARNGFITVAQRDAAVATPLGTVLRQSAPRNETSGGYFTEEVRRQLIDMFGETGRDGPYSVYAGGLWVRTSYDPEIQRHTANALRAGLLRFDRGRGWSGPVRNLAINGNDWRGALVNSNLGIDYEDWRVAIVISKSANSAEIGFADGSTGTLPRWGAQLPVRGEGGVAFAKLTRGDAIVVAPERGQFTLRSIPRISGGMVVEQPQTGRILAMQGGFDARLQSFNRATQAQRQPGSTIKPIVYAAALENGMTPASIIVDGSFCVYQSAALGRKCFRNFGGGGGAGPRTMRWGIEQSRNLMTVRAAAQTGMDNVVDLMQRMGVSPQRYPPYLAYALGAGETTVLRMVNAYSILVNQGRALNPTLIDYVQDRRGQVVYPANWRACERCNAPDYDGTPMPRPARRGRQVLDPVSAFQMVNITEGVIQRGTATILRDLGRPIMGKTGTTTQSKDVWFIGGTPQMVAGLYIGFDRPTPMGGYAQGGTVAAPIFKAFAREAFSGLDPLPFEAPAGTRMVRIDRTSGRRVFGAWPSTEPRAGVIWEAFKPESEPRRVGRDEEGPIKAAPKKAIEQRSAPADSDFLQREGGIY